jgi:hypothetical protein
MLLIAERCRVAGIDSVCPTCAGQGHLASAEQRAAAEAWQSTPPPDGPGWQLWETVTEGSPQSPVFASAPDLVAWLVQVEGYRRTAAEALVEEGESFSSLFMTGGRLFDGARDLDRLPV